MSSSIPLDYLKSTYVGKTIKILDMAGEKEYKGRMGVVKLVDDMGQLHGTWGGLALIPAEDQFEIVEQGG